ncbi:unnamed protein product [Hermetia illucens]|uniref:RRM domain-containing protein n=1 Tax=Hermetia illucens TaxID=343691 RepID=A0A7R8YTJ7_HERIL|nr:unnamed protein product [Hermetia illucens]
MESGLLSTFHDDHFDGNYSKYDNNLDLWSDGNDGMGLQLSETLHGILPIAANEEAPHFFETELEHRIPYRFGSENDGLTETIIEMDKDEEEGYLLTNYDAADDMSDSMSPSLEIISVDPNCDFTSPITVDDDDDEAEGDEEMDSDRCSSRSSDCSSNSEVSSIADYESHSSDESDIDTVNNQECLDMSRIKVEGQSRNKLKNTNNGISTPKKVESNYEDRNSTSLSLSECDGILDAQVDDIKDFDLATYITQDNVDFPKLTNNRTHESSNKVHSNPSNYLVNSDHVKIEPKCDSDTEAIIDIETVHDNEEDVKPMLLRKQTIDYSSCVDFNESFTQCDDDVKHDPSWSPKAEKQGKGIKTKGGRQAKGKKTSNLMSQCNRMLSNSCASNNFSSKPHVVMDRKKYGLGKGKNISMCTKPELSDFSDSDIESDLETIDTRCIKQETVDSKETCAIESNLCKSNVNEPKTENKTNAISEPSTPKIETTVKVENVAIKKEEPVDVSKTEIKDAHCPDGTKDVSSQENEKVNSEVPHLVPVKKKLNLEEYKRRRENQLIGDTKIKKCIPCDPIPIQAPSKIKIEDSKKTDPTPVPPQIQNNQKTPVPKLTQPANGKSGKDFYDPILEAKNKVLRMQELKKAAQSKRIDSTVSAKVGPITPILPLEQICNGKYNAQNSSTTKLNPDYEEIIIVSASSNTEITLPPVFEKLDTNSIPDRKNNPLTAVIKSSSLLSNISDTMKKTNAVKISSSSLLSSIQDVVLKQSTTTLLNGGQLSQKSPNIGVSPPSHFSPQKPEMSHTDQTDTVSAEKPTVKETGRDIEHGEDKIIMHLRKDRIRKKTFSVSIQTEELPQFPPLTLLLAEKLSSNPTNTGRKRKRHYRSRRDSSAASSDDNDYQSSSRSHVRYRSVSSHGTNRSVSPRSSRYSYSSSRRTVSPYHKTRRRSSRSSSRTKYASDSSDPETGRRSRSRERRTRRYSSSHNTSSSSSSSDTSSRSRSRSRSSRSRSRSRSHYSSGNRQRRSSFRRNTSPAVEERRIVYVGRIERETSKEDLKRKFISYGPIRQITVHYKDTGMKYGFVTYEKAQDAYQVIDRSMNDPKINMYDISFGGRRAFCRATYSDLDGAATNSFQDHLPYSKPALRTPSFQEDSFESLLAKVKEKLTSAKASSPAPSSSSRCKT